MPRRQLRVGPDGPVRDARIDSGEAEGFPRKVLGPLIAPITDARKHQVI